MNDAASLRHEAGTPVSKLVTVPNDDEVLEFPGELIATSSTRLDGKNRWTELELYRVTDGSGRYVLHRIGMSALYHRHGNRTCGKGVTRPATALTAESVPCHICTPPLPAVLKALPGAQADIEVAHHGARICADATDVIKRLRWDDASSSGIGGGTSYSIPAQQLIDEAKYKDEGIYNAMTRVRRI